MSPRSALARLGRALAPVQAAAALLPLLCLGAELVHALRWDFEPALERYGGMRFEPAKAAIVQALARQAGKDESLAGPVYAVWGLGGGPGREPVGGVFLERLLEERGRVRLHAGTEPLPQELPARVAIVPSPLEAVEGADLLVLLSRQEEHRNAPVGEALAALSEPRLVFDALGTWADRTVEVEAAAAGYIPLWDTDRPFFLDPRMLRRVREWKRQMPEAARVLFLPGHLFPGWELRLRPLADLGSTRWFLPVGYHLLPRTSLVLDPVRQSGTLPDYQDFYDEIRGQGPWPPYLLQHHVEGSRADHVLRYRISPYFLDAEWALLPLSGGGEQP